MCPARLAIGPNGAAEERSPWASQARRCALLGEIKHIIAEQGSYGYRRTWAILRPERRNCGLPVPNHKRVYRVMRSHELLLQRSTGNTSDRRYDGKIAVDQSDLRWCSDGLTIACDIRRRSRSRFCIGLLRWRSDRLDCHVGARLPANISET